MLRSSRLLSILLLLVLLVNACQPITMPMSVSDADGTQVAHTLQAAYSAGDVAGLTAIMAPDAVDHMPPLPDITGIDAYRAAIADLRDALPNATLTFDAVNTSGAGITARYTITGTHSGPSLAFGPPTGFDYSFLR